MPGIESLMKQTPAHDRHNPDVLRLMPKNLKRVVEVGCSSGALARAYTAENPGCEYTGIEIDPEYAERAKASCGSVICADVESMSEEAFLSPFSIRLLGIRRLFGTPARSLGFAQARARPRANGRCHCRLHSQCSALERPGTAQLRRLLVRGSRSPGSHSLALVYADHHYRAVPIDRLSHRRRSFESR